MIRQKRGRAREWTFLIGDLATIYSAEGVVITLVPQNPCLWMHSAVGYI